MASRFYLVGGVIHVFFAISHGFFPQMFDWDKNLIYLDADNYGIFLTYHLCFLFILAAIACISFAYRHRLAVTDPGKAFSWMVAGVYGIRIITQFRYFPQDDLITTLTIVGLCVVTMSVYLLPLFIDSRQSRLA